MYRGYWQFKGIVFFVVGDDQKMLSVASGFDTFDECPLVGIDDIYFIPLEKQI